MNIVKKATLNKNLVVRVAKMANKANPLTPDSKEFYKALEGHYQRIKEELQELREAIDNKDGIEILDAMNDLDVVVTGGQIELELAGFNVAKALTKIGANNLTKVGLSEELATKSANLLTENTGDEHIAEYNNYSGLYCVKRVRDNKFCKPIGFSDVSINDCVPLIYRRK